MNLSKIHHIAIIVSDYEVAKDFYVNKLGFSVIRENYRPERKDWKLDLRVNEHTELEIFAEENPPAHSPSAPRSPHKMQGDAAHRPPVGSHASAGFLLQKSPALCVR